MFTIYYSKAIFVDTQRHLAPKGANVCDYGVSIAQDECETAVTTFAKMEGKVPEKNLQVGKGGTCLDNKWGQVPVGCSAQSGTGWTPHYKTESDSGPGCIHSMYQLVCVTSGKYRVCYICKILFSDNWQRKTILYVNFLTVKVAVT